VFILKRRVLSQAELLLEFALVMRRGVWKPDETGVC
jgi:hypothetical protein